MVQKELIIVGGANGAGKTTFAVEFAARRGALFLGADAIAAEISPGSPELVAVSAGYELLRRLDTALSQDDAFVLESTLAGRTMRHTIHAARKAGFVIKIAYLYVDSPDVCIQRVEQRVRKGGHSVPESDIRRRFVRSIRNFWRLYRPLADRWVLIYNSGNRPLDVAAGTAEDVSVRDAELFAMFAEWVESGRDG